MTDKIKHQIETRMKFKYLAYNIIKTNPLLLWKYLSTASGVSKNGKINIFIHMLQCYKNHDTGFLDYFHYRYFNDTTKIKQNSNIWEMHQFHKRNNSISHICKFRDKLLFRKSFNKFFNYPYFILEKSSSIDSLNNWIEKNCTNKIVAKKSNGSAGNGVKVLTIKKLNGTIHLDNALLPLAIKNLIKNGFTLLESYIDQHKILNDIHPNSINTIRIVTLINNSNELEIWGAFLRIGYDREIDNFSAGGISASIDIHTGIVTGHGKRKDPFLDVSYDKHPLTGQPILGVKIPFWNVVINTIKEASFIIPEVRTVGWDIAITSKGPTLIEGNDNWDKTHFEIVSGTGLANRVSKALTN